MNIKINKSRLRSLIREEFSKSERLQEGSDLYKTITGDKGMSWSEFKDYADRQKVADALDLDIRIDGTAGPNQELNAAIQDLSAERIRELLGGSSTPSPPPAPTEEEPAEEEEEEEGGEQSARAPTGTGTGGRGERVRRATTHDRSGTTRRRRGGKVWKYRWRERAPTIDRNGRETPLAMVKIVFKDPQATVPSTVDELRRKMKRLVVNPRGTGPRGRRFAVRPDDDNINEYLRIVTMNHSAFTLDETDDDRVDETWMKIIGEDL